MRTEDEILKGAVDRPAFSNGTSWEIWSYNWCCRCKNDSMGLNPDAREKFCPLITVAVCHQKTPTEWTGDDQDYTCIEFDERGKRGGGGHEPRPKPEPPDMSGLFERPDRRVRMLKQPAESAVLS